MKNLTRSSVALLIGCALFLVSCAAFRGMDTTKLVIGMDKETAYKVLMQKPDNIIVVKQYPAGTLEVVEYTPAVAPPATATPATNNHLRQSGFWLYFFNNKLVQYGRGGNLEEESAHIVAMHADQIGYK